MKYYFGLDALRASMMLLGLFIHAVYFMNTTATYQPSDELKILSNFFTFFRMECFFILSGFLTAMLITKKGDSYLVDNRVRRVIVPFLSSFLVVSVVFSYIYEPDVFSSKGLSYFIQHLWFLITLAILSLLSISNIFKNFLNLKLDFFAKVLLLFIFYIGCRAVEIFIRNKVSPFFMELYIYTILKTSFFLIFYYIGCHFYKYSAPLEGVVKNKFTYGILGLFFALISSYIFYISEIKDIKLTTMYLIIRNISDFGVALFFSFFLFSIFYSINRSNKVIRFLVDSSLIVYVFHFPVLKVLNNIFKGYYFMNSSLYMLFLIVSTFLITVAIYFLLKQTSFTRKMFGYK